MGAPVATFLWRRFDWLGLDAGRLFELARGWRLEGTATFREGGRICRLGYEVETDTDWRARGARVWGHVGRRNVALQIRPVGAAGEGRWRLAGGAGREVAGCLDLDLAFTPATNLLAIRRLALEVGQRASAPAAWLRFPGLRLVKLPQSYHRIGADEYAYEAPTAGYAGVLRVLPNGAVRHYPALFELVDALPRPKGS
jgi:hypothetical protein